MSIKCLTKITNWFVLTTLVALVLTSMPKINVCQRGLNKAKGIAKTAVTYVRESTKHKIPKKDGPTVVYFYLRL